MVLGLPCRMWTDWFRASPLPRAARGGAESTPGALTLGGACGPVGASFASRKQGSRRAGRQRGWLRLVMLAALCGAAARGPTALGAETTVYPADPAWPAPQPAPDVLPGDIFAPPLAPISEIGSAAGAPHVSEWTPDAGPDETFFAVGARLDGEWIAWGRSAAAPAGQLWPLKVQLADPRYAAITVPEQAFDGPMIVWARNAAGFSTPIRLNVPQPWWCRVEPQLDGAIVRIFGRNLSQRPDHATAWVYLSQEGQAGRWLPVLAAGKYHVAARLPDGLPPGAYTLWVHAGHGGALGWGEPLALSIPERVPQAGAAAGLSVAPAADLDLQQVLDRAIAAGKTEVVLAPGAYRLRGTLRVPAGLLLRGAGMAQTRLHCPVDPRARFAHPGRNPWNAAPGAIHTPGDELEYRVRFPAAGSYAVFLRYATEMKPYGLEGVSGRMSLRLGEGAPVALDNLPNTGSFGTFRWSRAATLEVPSPGEHRLVWRNDKGGGITMDALVLAADKDYAPSDTRWPTSSDRVVVVQGEDVVRMTSKEGNLPRGDAPVVWLSGDGAALEGLTLSGSPQTNVGIAVGQANPLVPAVGCAVRRVRVVDIEGKHGENCGVRLENVAGAVVRDCELWGRAPLFLAGAFDCDFSNNRLVPLTRFGGNAEAVILGRCERIERCVIEGNRIASPPGAECGGPTGRRLLWFSTGRGSIVHNYIADNGVEPPAGAAARGAGGGAGQARFGGVAGTDQNVGEMILFEANHRTMFFGKLRAGDARSVTLPEAFSPTPDERLGSVKREQLPRDPSGNETPFWPPDQFDLTPEPPIHQYFVTVFDGPGQGQTRRVVRREGTRLVLDRPWRVVPDAGSTVAVGTMFHRNLIVGNHTPDGMTGVQLWISCVENVVAANTIARQRKPGLFLYASGTTLAGSMSRTWNRGLSPLFFNHVEGNRTDECSAGALVTSGDAAELPVEFPRALGNVLRHNSFVRSRTDGVIVAGRPRQPDSPDVSASVVGTIIEFNVARDALTGYHLAAGDVAVVRRNHAYFWYPVASGDRPPVGIAIDRPTTRAAAELNSVEGIHGTGDGRIVELKRPDDQR